MTYNYSDGEEDQSVRPMKVRTRTHRAVAEMAAFERRSLIDELDILVERGIAATRADARPATPAHPPDPNNGASTR